MASVSPLKKNQVRMYLSDPDKKTLERLAEVTGLSEANVLSVLVAASLAATKENDYRMNLPLKFKVSDGYLRQLRHCFEGFTKGRSRTPIGAITTADLEEWLDGLDVSPRTVKGRTQYLKTLFSFAVRRGYLAASPAEPLELPTITGDTTGVHSPADVAKVMAAALAVAPRVALVLALRYFAGLRAIEVARLGPEDIHLERRRIIVPAHKAKTRQRRIVTIQPNLAAWLALGAELPGVTCEQQICEAWQAAGVAWPRNVARHSFVSYHLAAFGSAAKTAEEAGHSEAMLFGTYRELVTPEDAAEFWRIKP